MTDTDTAVDAPSAGRCWAVWLDVYRNVAEIVGRCGS